MSREELNLLRNTVERLEKALGFLKTIKCGEVPFDTFSRILDARLEVAHSQGAIWGFHDAHAAAVGAAKIEEVT